MKIADDIFKNSTGVTNKKTASKFGVLDTKAQFWDDINRRVSAAKIFDATALLAPFSGVSRFTTIFERCVEFGNLAPIHHSIWVEAADAQMPAHLAVLLQYEKNTEQSYLADQARQYGISCAFNWICHTRCFIKPRYKQTIPLKWEWIVLTHNALRCLMPDGLPGFFQPYPPVFLHSE